MPLRYIPTGAALRPLFRLSSPTPYPYLLPHHPLLFHSSSRARRHDDPNFDTDHYTTLNLGPSATPAEIKKSYFRLSKLHHPDHNPSDPSAPKRFMRISEAYAVLGSAEKRARYDREVMRRPPHGNPHYHHGHGHSHTGPAGGRPASGLSSRRRGTFTGPPPSFFKSGGWGTHSSKRRQAHEESTGQRGTPDGKRPPGWKESARANRYDQHPGGHGGMGHGQDPFRNRHDDVHHFDKAAHERTHQRVGDQRRAARAARKMGISLEPDTGSMWRFCMFSGVLVAAIGGGIILGGKDNSVPQDRRMVTRTLPPASSPS